MTVDNTGRALLCCEYAPYPHAQVQRKENTCEPSCRRIRTCDTCTERADLKPVALTEGFGPAHLKQPKNRPLHPNERPETGWSCKTKESRGGWGVDRASRGDNEVRGGGGGFQPGTLVPLCSPLPQNGIKLRRDVILAKPEAPAYLHLHHPGLMTHLDGDMCSQNSHKSLCFNLQSCNCFIPEVF